MPLLVGSEPDGCGGWCQSSMFLHSTEYAKTFRWFKYHLKEEKRCSELIERGCKFLGDIALWSDLFVLGNYSLRPLDLSWPDTKYSLPTVVFPPDSAELTANRNDCDRGSAKRVALNRVSSCSLDIRWMLRGSEESFHAKPKPVFEYCGDNDRFSRGGEEHEASLNRAKLRRRGKEQLTFSPCC